MANSIEILEKLIAFPTVSRDSNLELIEFVRAFLSARGIASWLVHNETGTKANLFASIGPSGRSGILLSGHTDVVPVDGQNWTTDPFSLARVGDLLFGRGTADMKGFIACALRAAGLASRRRLKTPLWLSFSYDEEIGCIGVRRLIDIMFDKQLTPACCIVGEPTSMEVATGHKGKTALRAECFGQAAHTAFAPLAVNALHLACDFVGCLRQAQDELAEGGSSDSDYTVPYTTIHAARITGGIAANIVPDNCTVEFEIRNIGADDPAKLLANMDACANKIGENARKLTSEARIELSVANSYPGLDTPVNSDVVKLVQALTAGAGTVKVAFGTEGGLFASRFSTPVVICGPGSMDQGHKPNEFISIQQLGRCDAMLDGLLDRLELGI